MNFDRIPKVGILAALADSSEGDPKIGRVILASTDRTARDEEFSWRF